MKKLAERFEQLAQMLAQFFSGLSVIVIALLGLILLVRIGLELKVLVSLVWWLCKGCVCCLK